MGLIFAVAVLITGTAFVIYIRSFAKAPLSESEAIELAGGYVNIENLKLLSAELLPVEEFIHDNAIVTIQDNVHVSIDMKFAQWPDKIWVIKFRSNDGIITAMLDAYTSRMLSGPLPYPFGSNLGIF